MNSSNQLEASISAADVASVGSAMVTVVDGRGGTTSNALQFQILSEPANVTPTVTATATPTSGEAPLPVQLSAAADDADGSIAAYVWNFGDGGTSSSPSVSHTYSVAGTYAAKVTVTDDKGATATSTVNVNVSATSSSESPSTAGCTKTISPGTGVLQTALNNLSAGNVLCLRGGTYYTGGTFGTSTDTTTFTRSGSSSAMIKVQAYPGEIPIIKGQFKISGSYLHLAGLVFEGPLSRNQASATERRSNQVEFSGSHHVIFERNEVRHNDYHAGVYLANVNNIQIRRCYIHDNGRFQISTDPVTGASVWNVDHGVYWGSTSGGGNVMADNVIARNRGYGLHFYPNPTDLVVVQNTTVYNGNSGIILAGSNVNRITLANNVAAFNSRNPQIRILNGTHTVTNNLTWSTSSSIAGIQNSTSSTLSLNRVADPRFTSTTNYKLLSGSPAIDKALATYSTLLDFLGTTRPKGAGPDQGAYEYVP